MMTYFMLALSMVVTLGFCWLVDHENFAYHVAAVLLLETCTLFWIVFPIV